ncbi:MAG: hypothetical protein ACSNEK_09555 [Parachlamydiaceae bacterium]
MFPCIRDFSESYFYRGVNLPDGFPSPSSICHRITHLCKVSSVFTQEECREFSKAIRASKVVTSIAQRKGGRRDFYIAPAVNHFEVKFKEGTVQENLITSPRYTQLSSDIKKIVLLAMERLAKELNWENTTRHLACYAVEYHVTHGADEPLIWHNDGWASEAEYSFVILLSDPNDIEKGWSGGDLLYTAARVFELARLDDKARKKLDDLSDATKGEAKNDPSFPIWKISPTYGDGILFGNKGMRHKITAMSPQKNEGSRMVLTVFDFGSALESA